MKKLYALAIVCFIVVGFTGCSLLKVSVSTGDPLTDSENDIRITTRGFYQTFSSQIIQVADSIIGGTDDMKSKIQAVRWKLDVTRAATSAALKSVPELSAVETWVLCKNLDKTLKALPDSSLFGYQTPLARSTVERLERLYSQQLAEVMSKEKFALMSEFVERYSRAITSDTYPHLPNPSTEWIEFLKEKGISYKRSVGSVSEVIADASERMESYADQVSKDLSFSKEIVEYRFEQDSIYDRLNFRLNSMEHDFDRLVSVMEHLPELSDSVLDSLDRQAQEIMELMSLMVDETFNNFDYQRREMQRYISEERGKIMEEMQVMADDSLRTLLDNLPTLVGKMIGWIILLVAVILGVPFLAGFWLGKLHERLCWKKKEKRER
ncbi:hypothetical protein [Bacteroides salyersiae]|uniref:hypothetical protein n=1 Tax=Bacteroides salyersiae TaxID=291644 RepID=UPI00189A794C|nr:hypothetical protein [Bacteroides salyersiae]